MDGNHFLDYPTEVSNPRIARPQNDDSEVWVDLTAEFERQAMTLEMSKETALALIEVLKSQVA